MSGFQTQTEAGINKDKFKMSELTNIDENYSVSFQDGILAVLEIISDKSGLEE
jgi:hypothetical protein